MSISLSKSISNCDVNSSQYALRRLSNSLISQMGWKSYRPGDYYSAWKDPDGNTVSYDNVPNPCANVDDCLKIKPRNMCLVINIAGNGTSTCKCNHNQHKSESQNDMLTPAISVSVAIAEFLESKQNMEM